VLPPQIQGPTSLEQTTSLLAASLPATPSACAYADFYGFVEPPFGMTPNTRFVFWGGSVSIALEQVMRGLGAREGVMVITGDTGTGKTLLCRALAHHLRQDAFLSMVVNPTLGPTDLLKQILDDFGVTAREHPATGTNYELFRALEQFLVARIPQGDRAVVLIDEAHHLHPQVLEQIRLLSNLESQDAKLLQFILVGRPDLEVSLGQPDQRELDQRVSRRCELLPLSPTEIHRYINHRMAVAQATSTNTVDDPTPVEPVLVADGTSHGLQGRLIAFTPAALAAVTTMSRGVPRIINLLCDRALEAGFAGESRVIDAVHVLGGAARLRLTAPPERRRVDARTIAVAAAVVAVIVAGAGVINRGRPAQPRTEPIAAPVAALAAVPAPAVGTPEAARPVTLAVASFKTEERAAELVAKLVDLGLPAFDRDDAPNGWHRVTVGPYASVEEARAAERRITGVGLTNIPVVSIGAGQKAGRSSAKEVPAANSGRSDPPAPTAAAPPETDVLTRARAMAQVPDVRALMRLRDEVMRRGERTGQLDSDDFKRVLEAVERYTNEARALQLQIDGRGFRGLNPGGTDSAGRSGPGTPR
jgi:type II secretory pathway predicted ATPase ExeA